MPAAYEEYGPEDWADFTPDQRQAFVTQYGKPPKGIDEKLDLSSVPRAAAREASERTRRRVLAPGIAAPLPSRPIGVAEAIGGGLAGGLVMRPYEQVAAALHPGTQPILSETAQGALSTAESVGLLAPQTALAAAGEAVGGPGLSGLGMMAPRAALEAQRGGLPAAEAAIAAQTPATLGMFAGGALTAGMGRLGQTAGATAGMLAPGLLTGEKPTVEELSFAAIPFVHLGASRLIARGRGVGADAPEVAPPAERVAAIVREIEAWEAEQRNVASLTTPPEAAAPPPAVPRRTPPGERGSATAAAATMGLAPLIEHDVIPGIQAAAGGVAETARLATRALAPRVGVAPRALDEVYKRYGDLYRAQFQVDYLFHRAEQRFASMPDQARVDFIDAVKTGARQPTADLDALAKSMRDLDTASWRAARAEGIPVNWKESHFRVFWQTPPGQSARTRRLFGLGRRPLEGTRGMLKRATLDTISDGIAAGGVPVTTNPVTLFRMAQVDLWKLTATRRMWNWAKANNLAQFVRKGEDRPEGFIPVDDRIGDVYFKTDQGMVNPGRYYVEENFGRLLNNMVAPDLIRQTAAGRGLLAVKNHLTAIELGLSAFHATFETGEAMGSQLGIAARTAWNLGVAQGKPGAFKDSVGELLSAPAAAATLAKEGGDIIRYAGNKQEFLATSRGQKYVARVGSAEAELFDRMWAPSGAKLEMHADYKLKSIAAFKDALAKGNPLGALLRSPLAANQMLMRPLFEVYIPRLKVGLWAREFALARQEHAAELASGALSEAALGRQVWHFVENRFGEMNFDTLFWNPTLKTGLQLAFRSVTWKLGNLLSFGAIAPRQLFEVARAAKEGRIPRLVPEAAWMMGMSGLTAAAGTVISKAFSGRYPWEYPGNVIHNTVFPHVDPEDPDVRLTTPTYWKDLFHLYHSPKGYLTSGFSSAASKTFELWANQDFYGTEVYDPDGSIREKAIQVVEHYIPKPFSVASFLQLREAGESPALQGAGFLGFTKAPGYVSRTPAEEQAREDYSKTLPRVRTQEEAERSKRRAILTSRIMRGKATGDEIHNAIIDLGLSATQIKNIAKAAHESPLRKMVERIPLATALKTWEKADVEERAAIGPVLRMRLYHEIQAHGNQGMILERAREVGLIGETVH